jgi:2-polyprenyl-3-methyl-5-hydroxy-6-metoxy-1,4-benzoquinol methylase
MSFQKKYNNSFNSLDKLIAKLRQREMKKNISLKNKNILDFGCGSNFKKLISVYKDCQSITAIDRTGSDFKIKNFYFYNYQDDLNILEKKIMRQKFDVVILGAVIEHLDKPELVLNILKKRLSDDGIIFLTAPSWASKPILEFLGYKLNIINADLVREHKRYYDLDEYKKLSKLIKMDIKKFYFFQLGLNTVCILR